MIVRRIRSGEGAVLREIRLRALEDAPTAFAMTYAEEVDYPAALWEEWARDRSRSETDTTLFAEAGGEVVGLVGGYLAEQGVFHLVSMWVAPEARRLGAGRALTSALIDFATTTGATELRLWVNATNEPAVRLYASAGLGFDGSEEPLPSHPRETERRMTRGL